MADIMPIVIIAKILVIVSVAYRIVTVSIGARMGDIIAVVPMERPGWSSGPLSAAFWAIRLRRVDPRFLEPYLVPGPAQSRGARSTEVTPAAVSFARSGRRSSLFERTLERVLVLAGEVDHLRDLGFGDLVGKDAALPFLRAFAASREKNPSFSPLLRHRVHAKPRRGEDLRQRFSLTKRFCSLNVPLVL